MLGASLVSFLVLVVTWLALPASSGAAEAPSRVTVQRRSVAEA